MVLEKDAEDRLDRSCEKLRSVIQSHGGKDYVKKKLTGLVIFFVRGSRSVARIMHNLAGRGRPEANFTPWQIYSRGKGCWYPLNRIVGAGLLAVNDGP